MRRLPEIDLANAAALSPEQRRVLLWRLNLKNPKVNYQPTRNAEPDIFNARGELLGLAQAADLEAIKDRIRRDPRNRNAATEDANLEVAERLHDWAVQNQIQARRYHIAPFDLAGAAGIRLTYWSRQVLVKGQRLYVTFMDPRRQNGLTSQGRRFAFSMMHHRARTVYLDLEDAELAIFQFPMSDEEEAVRRLKVHTASELSEPLFEYDELEQRVRETYALWRVVLAERDAELRRKADDGREDFGLSA